MISTQQQEHTPSDYFHTWTIIIIMIPTIFGMHHQCTVVVSVLNTASGCDAGGSFLPKAILFDGRYVCTDTPITQKIK